MFRREKKVSFFGGKSKLFAVFFAFFSRPKSKLFADFPENFGVGNPLKICTDDYHKIDPSRFFTQIASKSFVFSSKVDTFFIEIWYFFSTKVETFCRFSGNFRAKSFVFSSKVETFFIEIWWFFSTKVETFWFSGNFGFHFGTPNSYESYCAENMGMVLRETTLYSPLRPKQLIKLWKCFACSSPTSESCYENKTLAPPAIKEEPVVEPVLIQPAEPVRKPPFQILKWSNHARNGSFLVRKRCSPSETARKNGWGMEADPVRLTPPRSECSENPSLPDVRRFESKTMLRIRSV